MMPGMGKMMGGKKAKSKKMGAKSFFKGGGNKPPFGGAKRLSSQKRGALAKRPI